MPEKNHFLVPQEPFSEHFQKINKKTFSLSVKNFFSTIKNLFVEWKGSTDIVIHGTINAIKEPLCLRV